MATLEEANRVHEQGKDDYRAGEYEEALESFTRARELYAEAGDQAGASEALNNMGVISIQLEQWDQALQCIEEARAICIDVQDRSGEAKTLGNLGMAYERMGDQEKAAEAYLESIEIFRELGERGNEKAVARQLSKLKLKKGKLLDAVGDYYEELEGEEEPSGAQKLARRMFRLLGRLTGGGSVEEGDEDDVVDVPPEPEQDG